MSTGSNDVTVDLVRSLVDHMNTASDTDLSDWEALSMVVEIGEGYFSVHGYAYPADGTITPVAADPGPTQVAVNAYLASHYQPGEALPVALLVQLDRATGHYSVTFEDIDETRWKVTPRNFRQIREDLRPRFDDAE